MIHISWEGFNTATSNDGIQRKIPRQWKTPQRYSYEKDIFASDGKEKVLWVT